MSKKTKQKVTKQNKKLQEDNERLLEDNQRLVQREAALLEAVGSPSHRGVGSPHRLLQIDELSRQNEELMQQLKLSLHKEVEYNLLIEQHMRKHPPKERTHGSGTC